MGGCDLQGLAEACLGFRLYFKGNREPLKVLSRQVVCWMELGLGGPGVTQDKKWGD